MGEDVYFYLYIYVSFYFMTRNSQSNFVGSKGRGLTCSKRRKWNDRFTNVTQRREAVVHRSRISCLEL